MGTDPAGIRWNIIKTPYYNVIYPRELDSLAKRYTFLLESLRAPVLSSINANPAKIDVILHPYSSMSNGMVGVVPKRMELITRPPANDNYIFNWEKHLVIHETRHTGQIAKFEAGFFKPLKWLIGEHATALAMGVYMSRWKLEGDAVISETELTSGGRGRDPDHLIYFRVAFLEGDYRCWDRWVLGSYKSYTPDVYSFGYLFSSFVRKNSGNYNYLGEATEYLVKRFYDPKADQKGYKIATGLTKRENFDLLKSVMTKKWREEDSIRAPFTRFERINRVSGGFASYNYPLQLSEDIVLAVKFDLKRGYNIVKINKDGKESHVREMGRLSSPPLLMEGKLLWSEFIQSPRWELESYSDIFSYDLKSGITTRLSKGETLYNLSSSGEEDIMLMVSYPVTGSSKLIICSKETMKQLKSIAAPEGGQLKEGILTGDKIFATIAFDSGIALYSYNRSVNEWEMELPCQSTSFSNLRSFNREILFISSINGVSNIYSYNTDSKILHKLTNSRFGVGSFNLSSGGESLLYADFTHNGYDIVKADTDSLLWHQVSFSDYVEDEFAAQLSLDAQFNADTLKVPPYPDYASKPYRKVLNLFKIHSWAPLYYNVDVIKGLSYENLYSAITPGAIIMSQNSLSTANLIAGYSWSKGFHSGHFKFTYRGLYPVIEYSADINERNRYRYTIIEKPGSEPYQKKDTLINSPYFYSKLTLYTPLNLSRGGWSSGIIPSFVFNSTNDAHYTYQNNKFSNYRQIKVGLSLYRVLNMAHRDLFPRKGGGLNLQFSASPFSGENFGSVLYGYAYKYLPGILANNSLRLGIGYQKQFSENKRYYMPGSMGFPEGYELRNSKESLYLSMEYALPLLTKDLTLTSLLYLKRIHLMPFIKYRRDIGEKEVFEMLSYGSDFLFDSNIIGISYPVTIGVRGGFTKESKGFLNFIFKTPL